MDCRGSDSMATFATGLWEARLWTSHPTSEIHQHSGYMRILIICKKFLSRTETFIFNEIEQLSRQHDVKVLTLDRDNEDLFPHDDVEQIDAFRMPGWVRLRRITEQYTIPLTYRNPSLGRELDKKIREFKPDIIHCHYGPVGLLFTRNVDAGEIPVFVSFHGFDASQRIRSAIYCKDLRDMFERPNVHPIFVSNFMYQSVVDATGWDGSKKHIVYYGVKSSLFRRTIRHRNSGPVTFLQVSSFAEKKGHLYTIRAFKAFLSKPTATESKLILAGSGDYFDEIKTEVKNIGIARYVEFTGHVDHTTAMRLMDQASIFVHHSITARNGDTEGIPNALIEAMAMELPILSTIHAGIPELVENGVNGFLVAEKDVEDYANKMGAIASWDYKLENREKVMKLFDNKVHMEKLNCFYSEVLAP